ncbi:hypothetical protein [Phenylobacterium aquaticum]|uniref:hypothetical protein n=1 Tax=Phenylobacterium aquaticum TaxID=1763816 RepID=UPI0026F1A151|nr:hypothetical protein [Phenylobacterium aquaticum]
MVKRSKDFGGVARSGGVVWIALAVALAIGAPVTYVLGKAALERNAVALQESKVFTQDLTVTGAPCPSWTAAQYAAQPLRAQQVFSFDMIDFGRRFGHVECGVAGMHGADKIGERDVCQFTGPAVLEIKSGKGTFYFAPGVGVPATVSVQHGVPSCVMASKYRLPGA